MFIPLWQILGRTVSSLQCRTAATIYHDIEFVKNEKYRTECRGHYAYIWNEKRSFRKHLLLLFIPYLDMPSRGLHVCYRATQAVTIYLWLYEKHATLSNYVNFFIISNFINSYFIDILPNFQNMKNKPHFCWWFIAVKISSSERNVTFPLAGLPCCGM